MVKPIRMIRVAVLFGLLWLLSAWCGKPVSADTCLGYPRCGGCSTCILNVREFGHYQTVWRRWPGDPRPAEVFPRSINAEVLPTPAPGKQQPLPRTRLQAPGQETLEPGLPDTLPAMPGAFPGEGGLLPQEPAFDFRPGTPEVPAESGAEPLLPEALPGVPSLPGLPLEPGGPMPFEPPMEQPFSTIPDAGASMPPLMPPSVTATETPLEQPLPAIVMPEVVAPGEVASGATPSEVTDAQQTPQADVLPPELAASDQPAAEATDIATDAVPGPEVAETKIAEAIDLELAKPPEVSPPEPKALQANWMAALHPGFRGETSRIASSYSPVGSAVAVEPNEVPGKQASATQEMNASSQRERPVSYEQHVDEEAIAMPLALGGYCPVELLLNERWVQSDPRWTATHQGRRYLFAGEAQRRQFLDDPDRFVPVHSGNDPVLVVDEQRRVPGRMDYCVTYEGRLYMFSMADTLARFQEKPQRYAVKGD